MCRAAEEPGAGVVSLHSRAEAMLGRLSHEHGDGERDENLG
jgi:hypothetical protein